MKACKAEIIDRRLPTAPIFGAQTPVSALTYAYSLLACRGSILLASTMRCPLVPMLHSAAFPAGKYCATAQMVRWS